MSSILNKQTKLFRKKRSWTEGKEFTAKTTSKNKNLQLKLHKHKNKAVEIYSKFG